MKRFMIIILLIACFIGNAQKKNKIIWGGVYVGTTTFAIYNLKYPPLLSASLSSPVRYKRFGLSVGFILPVHRQTISIYAVSANYKIIGK